MRCITFLLLSVALQLPSTALAAEKFLYRYQDAQGRTVLNDKLPPEAAVRGYEIIRLDGTVVRSVEGELTDAAKQEKREAELRKEEQERLRKWDESLLLRYSEVADIESAKDRALREIRVRLVILKGNLTHLKRQVELAQAKAAETERLQGSVPEQQIDHLRTLKWQIADTEELIGVREQELNEVAASYDRDISRFKTLLDRIGERRR